MNTPDSLHEFKNQLSIILGFVEILLGETPQADAKRNDLLEIQRAAMRLLELLPESRFSPNDVVFPRRQP